MEKFIDKARTIMEALPYIREFYGKTVVVKYGGSAMDDEKLKEISIKDFVLLKLVGINLIVVHGGGPHISKLMEKLGKEVKFIEGYRYTDEETVEITEMVLSGLINKEIVARINFEGGKAVGVSGKDSNLIVSEKKKDYSGKNIDYGLVGEIVKVNPDILFNLIEGGYIPVVSPISIGVDGKTYNINADTAAGEIAIAARAYRLIYITDVRGIYKVPGDESTFIPSLHKDEIDDLKRDKIISKGMLPKVDSAIKALENGVEKVHIIDGRIEHSLLLELLTEAGIGTEILL
jgi:acetylglutamate kinase